MNGNSTSITLWRFTVFLTGRRDLDPASLISFARFLLAASAVFYAYIVLTPLTGFANYTYLLAGGHGDKLFEILRGAWLFSVENQFLPLSVSPYVSALTYVLILVLTVLTLAALWAESPVFGTYDKAVGLVLLTFPYWVAQMYFPYYHYGYALCNFLPVAAVALAWHSRNGFKFILALFLLIAGIAHYQGGITTAATTAAATLALMLARASFAGLPLKPVIGRGVRCFTLLAVGSVSYVVLHKAVLIYFRYKHLPPPDHAVILDANVPGRLQALEQAFFGSPFLLPEPLNAVYPFLLALTVALCLWRAAKRPYSLLVPPLLVAAVFSPAVLSLVQSKALYPRSMVAAAFGWALAFILADFLSGKRLRIPLYALAGLVVTFFFIRINYAWHIQDLTVRRDHVTAARIIERLENLPQTAAMPYPLPVSVIGCIPPENQPWATDYHTMFGHSQLTCFGDRASAVHASALLRFTGGNVKVIPPMSDDFDRVAGRAPWPAPDSVFADEYGLAVWLGGPRAAQRPVMAPGMAALAVGFGITDKEYLHDAHGATLAGDAWLYALAGSGEGPWLAAAPMEEAVGNLDSQTPLPEDARFVRVTGWAFDLARKRLPDRVILTDIKGRVIGFAATGIRRPDLVKYISPDAEYAGFIGYMLSSTRAEGFFYPR